MRRGRYREHSAFRCQISPRLLQGGVGYDPVERGAIGDKVVPLAPCAKTLAHRVVVGVVLVLGDFPGLLGFDEFARDVAAL